MSNFAIKRVYDPPQAGDGCRVLIDRLWPRGLKKEAAHADHWLQDLAPSDDLRKWFGHDPEKWDEFVRRYSAELDANREALQPLYALLQKEKKVTLLFSAKDEQHNNAVALAAYLRGRQGEG